MGNECCLIGSADACVNIELPRRCVNCGVMRLTKTNEICDVVGKERFDRVF